LLNMMDDVMLMGSPTFNLTTTTGGISIDIALPTGIGASMDGTVQTGTVDITAAGWIMVEQNHYKTTDYDTALQTLTVIAGTTTGGIDAVFT
jgi:predicted membrane protein